MWKALVERNGTIQTVEDPATPHTWIQMVSPSEEELAAVSQATGLFPDFLRAALDVHEQPRLETDCGQTMVLMEVPLCKDALCYRTVPLGVVISDQHIATICLEEIPVISGFSAKFQVHPGKRTRLLLQLVYRTAVLFIEAVHKLNAETEKLEGQLKLSQKNQQMFSLMEIQKSLVYLSIALKGNQILMDGLMRSSLRPDETRTDERDRSPIRLFPEDEDLLEDAIIENQQALSMCETHSNILTSMMDAFASIINNNLNQVMKILTSVTIVIAIPTMFGTLYGMNVSLPFQEHPWAFAGILTVAFLACVGGIILLWRKRML